MQDDDLLSTVPALQHSAAPPQTQGSNALSASEQRASELLTSVIAAIQNPDIDADKCKVLADLATSLEDREARKEFYRDKAAAMMAMPVITKDAQIVIPGKNGAPDRVQGRYKKYEDLQAIIAPILAQHNLVLSHNIGHNDHATTVRPILAHARNGFVEEGEAMSLPLDTSGSKNNTQGAGSASQYGRRYTTIAMLNIRLENEDDDGRRAGSSSMNPMERYNDSQRALIAEGNAAAQKGCAAYTEWFKSITIPQRGWLAEEGRHDEMKKAAGCQ